MWFTITSALLLRSPVHLQTIPRLPWQPIQNNSTTKMNEIRGARPTGSFLAYSQSVVDLMSSRLYFFITWMSSLNSIFGSSFNDSFDFQGFSSGAVENHSHHSHSRSRERSPHERSSSDSTRKERRRSQRRQARKRSKSPSLSSSSSSSCSAKRSRTSASQSSRSARQSQRQDSASSRNPPRQGIARMPGVAPMAAIGRPVPTIGNLPVMVIWTKG